MGDKAEKKPKVIHGVEMTPYGVFRFAQTYRVNADALALAVAEIGPQMSDHPRRFLYFQALENFLRSFLLLGGKTPEEVRDYNHNFAGMLDDSKALGLELPTEAEDCIRSRTLAKEYVRIRYDYKLDDENEPWVAAKTLEQLQTGGLCARKGRRPGYPGVEPGIHNAGRHKTHQDRRLRSLGSKADCAADERSLKPRS